MSTAGDLAEKSKLERVTAADVQHEGAEWDHLACAWRFADGSMGNFSRNISLTSRTSGSMFDHYLFEEVKLDA